MKHVVTYATYEEANDRQITLLAAGIDARVEFRARQGAVASEVLSGYELWVEVTRLDEANAFLSPVADPEHVCLYACPACGSDDVVEREPGLILGVVLLGLPLAIAIVRDRISGTPYRCRACGNHYRKKLTAVTKPPEAF